MFEHRHDRPIPFPDFLQRQVRHALIACAMVGGSLALGILGYRQFEGLSWIDSLLNAAMLLGGMGQVNELHTAGGKLFASFYALYSGVVFILVAGVLLAPAVHRLLHVFHVEGENDSSSNARDAPRTRRAPL